MKVMESKKLMELIESRLSYIENGAVVLVSGGMDSLTLLAATRYCNPATKLYALSMYYGQRHDNELKYAEYWANKFNATFKVLNLEFISDITKDCSSMIGASSLIPEDKPYDPNETPTTYVPMRNLVFGSVASMYAEANKTDLILSGIHSGDVAANYWDCSPTFRKALNDILKLRDIEYRSVFDDLTKGDICLLGSMIPNFQMENTWSCYKGGEVHCGACSTCQERKDAFIAAKVEDRTIYGS